MIIAINNIRVGKDIDFDYYGFNQNYIDSLQKKIDNVKKISGSNIFKLLIILI